MRRKSKRHKLIAVQFLSNISLDGTSQSRKLATFSDSYTGKFDAQLTHQHATYSGVATPQSFCLGQKGLSTIQHEKLETIFPPPETDCSVRRYLSSSATADIDISNGHFEHDRHHTVDVAQWTHKIPFHPSGRCSSISSAPLTLLNSGHHHVRLDVCRHSNVRSVFHPTPLSTCSGKRFAVCSSGFRRSVLAVFSILSNNRKMSTSTCRPTTRASKPTTLNLRNTYEVGDPMTRTSIFAGGSQRSSLDPLDRGQMLLDLETVPPLSSLPPTNDAVLSLARILHLHPGMAKGNGLAVRIYGPNGLEPDLIATLGPDSTLTLSSTHSRAGSLCNVNRPATTLGHVHSQRARIWSPAINAQGTYWPRTRRRHSSSTSAGAASLISLTSAAVCYPDPLVYYSPHLLDDPELLVATGRRWFPLSNYLVSVLSYVRPNEQKRNVNREFHERFPTIQLTLTKLRSIKSVLVQIIVRLSFDLWIAAQAHVLFEKLILKLFVNKSNRRLCASAALLISAKLNDIKGLDLNNLIQELETSFRISRRDLLHAEVEVTLGLEFCLIPSEAECIPHYFRIHKLLDLTPPYPISCLGQTGSVHSLHNEAAL